MIRYYLSIFRFVIFKSTPGNTTQCIWWSCVQPFHLWHKVCQYDQRTFAEIYLGDFDEIPFLKIFKNRYSFLALIFLYPVVIFFYCLRFGRGFFTQWRYSLTRPDLRVYFLKREFRREEIANLRPDLSLGVFNDFCYSMTRPDFFALDNKRVFSEACSKLGLPVPRSFQLGELETDADTKYMVKHASQDLGRGIEKRSARDILARPPGEEFVIQELVQNHEAFFSWLPTNSALATLRIVTNAFSGQPPCAASAELKFGLEGSVVDNLASGGYGAAVDLATGRVGRAASSAMVAVFEREQMISKHPDTGVEFVGFEVPHFKKMLGLCKDAHTKLAPDAVSIGWDVAVSNDGPVFLELNFYAGTSQIDFVPNELDEYCGDLIARIGVLAAA